MTTERIKMLEQQLAGEEAKGKELRAQEALFLKVQGMKESIEKKRLETSTTEDDIQALKEEIAELKGEKAEAVKGTIQAITEKMNAVLPEGEAVFEINGNVFFGWKIGKTVKPYHGLSGGEKVCFDGALANTLGAGVLVFEAAEADGGRLLKLVDQVTDIDSQVIINTWLNQGSSLPDGWNIIEVGHGT